MDTNKPECYNAVRARDSTVTSKSQSSKTDSTNVMQAIDESGESARFIVADTSRDDAWISMDADAVPPLTEWA